MNILGFNCYSHDAAATIVTDDMVRFGVEEERLSRKKHSGGFPTLAIQQCLESQQLGLDDIQHIAFSWKPSISYPKIPLFFLRYLPKMIALYKESRNWTMEENMGMFNYWKKMWALPQTIKSLYPKSKNANFKFHYLEHHLCHAASAYYPTEYQEAAIMTIDGGGEWTTCQLAHGQGNKIKKISTVDIPHSLGAFYQAIARYVGFEIVTGPGKLMGLSAYGDKDNEIYHRMKKIVHLLPDGGFKLDLDYFAYHYTRRRGVSERFEKEFGPAGKNGEWKDHHYHVAAAAQRIVEDVFIHMANFLYNKTGSENLCIAGGVGLNSVANGRLVDETPFKNIFIQPAAGDSGTSMGAALWVNHAILDRKRKYIMKDAFLGPGFSDNQYLEEIVQSGLPYIHANNYTQIAAKLLYQDKILGWFQGRMEFGPRALGNRSILATPCKSEMKDILNARVKFREGFRPFAPIVLEEFCGEYFDKSYPNPYMLMVYNVREEKKALLPAITHEDGSARIQTVSAKENPQLAQLLQAFKEESGIPILINTSFNVKGEPIVATPHDAIDSFNRADMDYLVLGDYIVAKTKKDLELCQLEQNQAENTSAPVILRSKTT
ncbi:MAG: carbamoyltransferase [Candidatus Omnitrophota bacterium]|jgi:carbamoyltransferase